MNKRPLSIIALTVLFAFALAGISCNRDKAPAKGTANVTPDQSKVLEAYAKSAEAAKKTMVGKINGVNISMNDLIREMNAIGPQYVKPGQKRDQKVDEKVRKDALDRLIYRELVVQEAARQGIKATPEEVGDGLKKLKAGLKSADAYRENLIKMGLTEEELKKQIERDILIERVTEKEIFGKVAINPEQVKKTYEKEKGSYKGPSGQMSFEEAGPLIEQKLMARAVGKREDEWVEGLKKAAKIEITLGESAKEIRRIN